MGSADPVLDASTVRVIRSPVPRSAGRAFCCFAVNSQLPTPNDASAHPRHAKVFTRPSPVAAMIRAMNYKRWIAAGLCAWLALLGRPAFAQSVTTGSITGVVTDGKKPVAGASVIAIHEPSGTSYEATTHEGRALLDSEHAGRRALHGDGELHRHRHRVRAEDDREPGREPRRRDRRERHRRRPSPDRKGHGRRADRSGVLLGAHRRGHDDHPRRAREPAHHHRPPRKRHAPDAAVRRDDVVRRAGQPR